MDAQALPSNTREIRRATGLLGSSLSFVAGYVDVVGFVALAGLFSAHVTGNFIMIGIELSGQQAGLLGKLLALPTFVLAVAATRVIEVRLAAANRSPAAYLLLAECVFLLLFMAAGIAASPLDDPATPTALATGLLAVIAMGIQNALSRTTLLELGPTTIMTGNTTQIVIDLVDLPGATASQRTTIHARLGKMVPALGGFAAGAIMGAYLHSALSMWSVLVPLIILLAVDARLWFEQRIGAQ